jgi:hypothetical protein
MQPLQGKKHRKNTYRRRSSLHSRLWAARSSAAEFIHRTRWKAAIFVPAGYGTGRCSIEGDQMLVNVGFRLLIRDSCPGLFLRQRMA